MFYNEPVKPPPIDGPIDEIATFNCSLTGGGASGSRSFLAQIDRLGRASGVSIPKIDFLPRESFDS